MSDDPFGFDTRQLHAGQKPDSATGARATPIYQSASFVFESAEDAVGLFNIERAGHVYSRLSIQPMPYSKSALRSWTKGLAL